MIFITLIVVEWGVPVPSCDHGVWREYPQSVVAHIH